VEKFGNRWMLVTPDGHGFWSFGVFAIVPTGNPQAKYGDADLTWGPQTVRRLRSWGFNTILDHSSLWVHAEQTCSGCSPSWANGQPEKMPTVWFEDAASYPIRNVFGYCSNPAKSIFERLNGAYYTRYSAPNPDPFDPCFATWITTHINTSAEFATAASNPYVIGFSSGESDFIWGFGSGAIADFPTIGGGENSPHIGWVVLIAAPTQTYNSYWGVTYSDTTLYAKQALKNFLQGRYGTIAALNAAWGSSYTTFDSNGGWGPGTGLLDEDGRHSWIPEGDVLAGATPAMKTDLDDFLYLYAEKWFKTQRDALKAKYPNMLYLGPNMVGSWGTPPRRQVLQAAGKYIDVFMTQIGVGAPDDQQRLDFTMQYLGDKPIASWFGITANADSSQYQYPDPSTFLTASTQAERAQIYDRMLNWYLNATVSPTVPGVGGVKPYIGVRWWGYLDNPGETANWGLVTPSDNAYDGIEAVTPLVSCSPPLNTYVCGGEARNFGNFLSGVKATNQAILNALP
jgi:hypothetical protein